MTCLFYWFKSYLIDPMTRHALDLAYYLDPVANEHNNKTCFKKKSTWSFTFFFPMISMVATFFYGNVLYVAVTIKENILKLDVKTLKNSSAMMYHQIFPRATWSQVEVAYCILATSAIALYATFLRRPFPSEERYKKIILQNHKKKKNINNIILVFRKQSN